LATAALAVALATSRSAHGDEAPTFADRTDETAEEATRSLALLCGPLAMAVGVFGAEADFALTHRIALAVEGAVYGLGPEPGMAVGTGVAFFPLRTVFHGLYLEPRVVFARRFRESPWAVDWTTDVVGLGGTAGWQWTWDYGFTVRLGAGAMSYFGGSGAVVQSSLPIAGTDAVLVADASLGWAF
jgi:hypothetical protein